MPYSNNEVRSENPAPAWAPAVPKDEPNPNQSQTPAAGEVKTTGPENWPYQLLVTVSSRFQVTRR